MASTKISGLMHKYEDCTMRIEGNQYKGVVIEVQDDYDSADTTIMYVILPTLNTEALRIYMLVGADRIHYIEKGVLPA